MRSIGAHTGRKVRDTKSSATATLIVQAPSVDERQDLVIDTRTMNEGDGWAGSGANPWHLDNQTESILFLTDESDQPARIGFHVVANGVTYYLTSLKLNPHETRAINLRKLRNAQNADFKKNKIPAGATDGSVEWNRLDNVAVTGRVVVIRRGQATASDYDCCTCCCPESYTALTVTPGSCTMLPGEFMDLNFSAAYQQPCNGLKDYYDVSGSVTLSSNNTTVATADSTYPYRCDAVGAGTCTMTGSFEDYDYASFDCPVVCSSAKLIKHTCTSNMNIDSLVFTITSGSAPNDSQGVIAKQQFNLQIQAKTPSGTVPDTGFNNQNVPFNLLNINTSVGEVAPSSVNFSSGTVTVNNMVIVLASGSTSAPSSVRTIVVSTNATGTVFFPYVYWYVKMDSEFWKNCDFTSCPTLGSYFCQIGCSPYSGLPSKTQFIALTDGSACNLGVVVSYGGVNVTTTVKDKGPVLNQPYWFTGDIPTIAGCLTDALEDALGIPNGCNPGPYPQSVQLYWRFQQ